MHWKQPLGGIPFLECFEAYAANLQEAVARMSKRDFNKDAELQVCWNHASEGGVPLSVRVFEIPYHGMFSERLLSIHHRLQIHCIVNVNICIKGPDDKTVVLCRLMQILT